MYFRFSKSDFLPSRLGGVVIGGMPSTFSKSPPPRPFNVQEVHRSDLILKQAEDIQGSQVPIPDVVPTGQAIRRSDQDPVSVRSPQEIGTGDDQSPPWTEWVSVFPHSLVDFNRGGPRLCVLL